LANSLQVSEEIDHLGKEKSKPLHQSQQRIFRPPLSRTCPASQTDLAVYSSTDDEVQILYDRAIAAELENKILRRRIEHLEMECNFLRSSSSYAALGPIEVHESTQQTNHIFAAAEPQFLRFSRSPQDQSHQIQAHLHPIRSEQDSRVAVHSNTKNTSISSSLVLSTFSLNTAGEQIIMPSRLGFEKHNPVGINSTDGQTLSSRKTLSTLGSSEDSEFEIIPMDQDFGQVYKSSQAFSGERDKERIDSVKRALTLLPNFASKPFFFSPNTLEESIYDVKGGSLHTERIGTVSELGRAKEGVQASLFLIV
jgi:hypothetical protein